MINRDGIPIHAIVTCQVCGMAFDNHETALRQARRHAARTGHTLKGEVAYRVMILPNPNATKRG